MTFPTGVCDWSKPGPGQTGATLWLIYQDGAGKVPRVQLSKAALVHPTPVHGGGGRDRPAAVLPGRDSSSRRGGGHACVRAWLG
jgi:hypothetical protein